MMPEARSEKVYPEVLGAQSDPFNFSNVFYNCLIRMGRPITLEQDADADFLVVNFADRETAKKSQEDFDRVYDHSLGAVFRSGSNEVLLLLAGREDAFYNRYPSVKERTPIDISILEKYFMREYESFLEYQKREIERSPHFRLPMGYPSIKEIRKYKELKKRGVSPITPSEMQDFLIPVIKGSR